MGTAGCTTGCVGGRVADDVVPAVRLGMLSAVHLPTGGLTVGKWPVGWETAEYWIGVLVWAGLAVPRRRAPDRG